jgi:hypothetical protein
MTEREQAEMRKRVWVIRELAHISEHKYERYVADDYCRDVPTLLDDIDRQRELLASIDGTLSVIERLMRDALAKADRQEAACRIALDFASSARFWLAIPHPRARTDSDIC